MGSTLEEENGGGPTMRPTPEYGQTIAEYALILAPLAVVLALSIALALMLGQ